MLNFGERLYELRKRDKMTQDILAVRLGVSKSMISAYEKGSRYPSYPILVKIASEFKVSTDYLLGLETHKNADLSGLTQQQQYAIFSLIKSMRHN